MLVFLLCLLFISSIANKSFANSAEDPPYTQYSEQGYRYYSLNIDYKHENIYATGPINAFNQAAADWNDVHNDINFYENSSSQNTVYADVVAEDMGGAYDVLVWVNSTQTRFSSFSAFINTLLPQGTNARAWRGSAGHEFGHILGLGHVGTANLMNGARNRNSIYTPQSGDIAGVYDIHNFD